jgi:hypothetical protein
MHGTLSVLLDFKLKSVGLAARKEAQTQPFVPLLSRRRHV